MRKVNRDESFQEDVENTVQYILVDENDTSFTFESLDEAKEYIFENELENECFHLYKIEKEMSVKTEVVIS